MWFPTKEVCSICEVFNGIGALAGRFCYKLVGPMHRTMIDCATQVIFGVGESSGMPKNLPDQLGTLGDIDMTEITVRNPKTGEALYAFEEVTGDDVAKAYQRARAAASRFGSLPVRDRVREVGKLKRFILHNRQQIIRQIVEETGKCETDALALEIFPALDIVDYYERNAERILADKAVRTPLVLAGKQSRIFHEPLGVVLIISPWNYPFHLSFVPVITAVLAGNAVILKPSKYTPLRGVFEKMIAESGFPQDVIQVVYASRRTAAPLIDQCPDKIMFTGSVEAGKAVMKQASQFLIPVHLELGGKDPMIVFEDVDIERTAHGAVWGAFANCGQTCTSVERIYVQEKIHDRFLAVLKEKTERLTTLSPEASGADADRLDVGCMTTDPQIESVESQLADALARGATIVTGGARVEGTRVFAPTILADVDHSMSIARDETFGPVVLVMKFQDEAEAVRLANDSPYGLSASVWSRDLLRARRVARKIKTGNVSINNVLATQAHSGLPYGGVKQSGFGRYRGEHGLLSFSNVKSVLIDKDSTTPEMHWYPYSRSKYSLLDRLMDALFGGRLGGLLPAAIIGWRLKTMAKREKL
jgi:acyl-CoA reductase-like NAD-dependent aldehyde dehydrogenase